MPIEVQGELARLLEEVAAGNGNKEAERELFELVYDELKKMAYSRMKEERSGHTLGATGLVHEVYGRLVKDPGVFSRNREYFFGAAAQAMRQLLREYARARKARLGREGARAWKARPHAHVDEPLLLDVIANELEETVRDDLIDLMEALDELEATVKHGKRRHDVVWLRFWSGWTHQEIANHLRVNVATVEADWYVARAWLYDRLKRRSIDA